VRGQRKLDPAQAVTDTGYSNRRMERKPEKMPTYYNSNYTEAKHSSMRLVYKSSELMYTQRLYK